MPARQWTLLSPAVLTLQILMREALGHFLPILPLSSISYALQSKPILCRYDPHRPEGRGIPSKCVRSMMRYARRRTLASRAFVPASREGCHSSVSQIFRELGFPETEGCGFTHSTGHGVGLDVHEKPSLSETGETLQTAQVVTVEPGLYYPQIGGVRLEDLVVVTENRVREPHPVREKARALTSDSKRSGSQKSCSQWWLQWTGKYWRSTEVPGESWPKCWKWRDQRLR